jgi:predicted Fe-Mo cluster-binding NifX family protein
MRIAVVSDNGRAVSQHFGRAPYYVVLAVEGDQIVSTETRPKAGHHSLAAQQHPTLAPGERHGYDAASQARHQTMAEAIADCQVLIAGGMGWGAFESLKARGIEPVVTDVRDIREAALRYSQGNLPNLMDRLH